MWQQINTILIVGTNAAAYYQDPKNIEIPKES